MSELAGFFRYFKLYLKESLIAPINTSSVCFMLNKMLIRFQVLLSCQCFRYHRFQRKSKEKEESKKLAVMLENNPEEAQELLTKIEKSRAEVGCTKSVCLCVRICVGGGVGWVCVWGGGRGVSVCLSVCLSVSL